jgi:hypothetical protein
MIRSGKDVGRGLPLLRDWCGNGEGRMYNAVFGQNKASDVILATLGITRGDCGRFRDTYIADGKIAVYTRNGGGNREGYQDVFDALSKHPCYLSDVDDDFDSTYATIYFSYPAEFAAELKSVESKEPFDPSKRWLDAIEALSNAGSK